MKRASVIAFATILAASCSSKDTDKPDERPLTPEERATLKRLVAKANALGNEHDRKRRAALVAMHAAKPPLPDSGKCPIKIRTPRGADSEQSAYTAMGNDPIYNILKVVRAELLATAKAPRLADELDTRLGWLKDRAPAEALREAKQLAATGFWTYDATLVADVWTLPRKRGAGFVPGRIRGRMYVWSYKRQAVVCAADVDAKSSPTIKVSLSDRAALSADLQVNALRQGLRKLVSLHTDAASPDKPAQGDGVFTLKKGNQRLPYARARLRGDQLEIALGSDAPPHCEDGKRPNNRHYASFYLTPGPGGRFFAGAPFGLPAGSDGSGYSSWGVRVSIQPFKLVPGGRIKGTLQLYTYGQGSFDAEICPGDYSKLHPLPAKAPNKPVQGTFQGKPWKLATALATVINEQGITRVNVVRLFPTANVSCADFWKHKRSEGVVHLTGYGGGAQKMPITGAPQPVQVVYSPRVYGWVQFDKLAFEAGKTITGKFVASSPPGRAAKHDVQLGGTFTAKLCPWKR